MKPIESKRVALDRKIVLRFPDFDGFVSEFAANLSMTGMFVRSKEPQPAGTPVAFELRLEDGAPLVRGSGWVVWSRDQGEGPDRPAGMGIEFTELDHKSRRLVRWMILNQLPEGSEPYEVRSKDAGGTPAPEGARGKGTGWRWRVPVVSGLLFAALAVLIFRSELGFRRAATEPASRAPSGDAAPDEPFRGSPIEAPVVATGSIDAESSARLEPQGPPAAEAAAAPIEPDAEDRAAQVEATVKSWARAWSDQDVDGYLAHYSTRFEPAGGLSFGEWTDQRRQRVAAPKSIRVAVTRLEAKALSGDQARVSFLQTYRSDGYSDTVDKVLDLVFEDGRWKIRRESAD